MPSHMFIFRAVPYWDSLDAFKHFIVYSDALKAVNIYFMQLGLLRDKWVV